jgi:hypothetical protein
MWRVPNRGNEMVVRGLPLGEFLSGQNIGGDLTPERLANARKELGHGAESDSPDHHKVHIAFRTRFLPCQGTENKCKFHLGLLESILKNTYQACGFQHEVPQISRNRAVPTGWVIKTIAIPTRRNPGARDTVSVLTYPGGMWAGIEYRWALRFASAAQFGCRRVRVRRKKG